MPLQLKTWAMPERKIPTPAGRDRNKPCPCGSGKKWKRCHARRST